MMNHLLHLPQVIFCKVLCFSIFKVTLVADDGSSEA